LQPARHSRETLAQAAAHGSGRALLGGAVIVLAGAAVALLASNTRHTAPVPEEEPEEEPALDLAA
jgi:acyl dehydratase